MYNKILFFCLLFSTFKLQTGRFIEPTKIESNVQVGENDLKVYQNGTTSGFIQSNSTNTAIMTASGSPAGIINSGGTTSSFSGYTAVSQDVPSNTSSSVGGSLSANCGGGQFGTFIAGQQHIGLHSNGSCNNYVNPKESLLPLTEAK